MMEIILAGHVRVDDLAHEWVVLFQAISGGKVGAEAMPIQIPDTVLLSPSGQPSVWYTTSSAGRVKAKDLMRVSPRAILEAFQTQLPCQGTLTSCTNDVMAVRRLGFEVDNLSRHQLKVFCRDMENPSICLPLEPSFTVASSSKPGRSGLTKGVFCLQRHIPCQNNTNFLIVWRHSPKSLNSEQDITPRSHGHDTSKRCTARAHSDVFMMTQSKMDNERSVGDSTINCAGESDNQRSDHLLSHLEIVRPDEKTSKTLRQSGFDPDVMAPLLFYMKRMTSEIANCINLGHNTQQACGLACEFFVGEHNGNVYFSALRGIQWLASAPSWELLRDVDALSRSLCDFYGTGLSSPRQGNGSRRRNPSTPRKPRSPVASDRAMYEQNPRFPSVHTPFVVEKQWLHRSQLVAPDISPRYIGVSVPKIFRDGVFQSLLTAHQADSVVRLNLSPQAPKSLTEVRRGQPQLSPRSVSVQRRAVKSISGSPNEGIVDM